jgi:hypothetical protein
MERVVQLRVARAGRPVFEEAGAGHGGTQQFGEFLEGWWHVDDGRMYALVGLVGARG